MSTIKLWHIIKEYGIVTRMKNQDGLVNWNKIKPILLSVKPIDGIKWNHKIMSYYNKMKSMGLMGFLQYN